MRLRKPYIQCRFCKNQIPKELFLFDGVVFTRDGKIRRMYRCSLCKATIYAELVTEKEKINNVIEDPEYTGKQTVWGCKHNSVI